LETENRSVPLKISDATHDNLEDNLLLFFTDYSRRAVAILKDQDVKSKSDEKECLKIRISSKASDRKTSVRLDR
jgi:galactokinase/mevalonate kinase-like predicted kinase